MLTCLCGGAGLDDTSGWGAPTELEQNNTFLLLLQVVPTDFGTKETKAVFAGWYKF